MAMGSGLRKGISQQSQKVLETGQRFTRFDQIRQRHFWSCYYFTPDVNGYISAGRFPLFVTPSGQNGQGFPSGVTMSDRETNWKSSNRVPDNQNFEITEIGVSLGIITPDVFQLDPETDYPVVAGIPPQLQSEFINNTIVSITYLTNSVPLGLAADFGQASAPHLGTFFGNKANTLIPKWVRSNGFPAPALRRRFKIPILLQHGETFSFAFEIPRSFFVGLQTVTVDDEEVNTSASPFIARFDFWATESFVEKS